MSSPALEPILDHVRKEPSRTWSIIITVYGDAIVPRGGSVWLGTLLLIFKALGISDGVVRTAMSRLATDGWLERKRTGRNSYYRLAEKGRETFRRATEHIYRHKPQAFSGLFDMVLFDSAGARDQSRAAMQDMGFGSPAPGLWIAPAESALPIEVASALRFRGGGDGRANRALAERAWPLAETAQAYRHFLGAFAPLRTALGNATSLSDLEALLARVLLIHEYRRIVLRDPILPLEILPEDWPGEEARALCADLYALLLPGSESWLDAHAIGEEGEPLPRDPEVFERFRS